jgi:hypothetical protein
MFIYNFLAIPTIAIVIPSNHTLVFWDFGGAREQDLREELFHL